MMRLLDRYIIFTFLKNFLISLLLLYLFCLTGELLSSSGIGIFRSFLKAVTFMDSSFSLAFFISAVLFFAKNAITKQSVAMRSVGVSNVRIFLNIFVVFIGFVCFYLFCYHSFIFKEIDNHLKGKVSDDVVSARYIILKDSPTDDGFCAVYLKKVVRDKLGFVFNSGFILCDEDSSMPVISIFGSGELKSYAGGLSKIYHDGEGFILSKSVNDINTIFLQQISSDNYYSFMELPFVISSVKSSGANAKSLYIQMFVIVQNVVCFFIFCAVPFCFLVNFNVRGAKMIYPILLSGLCVSLIYIYHIILIASFRISNPSNMCEIFASCLCVEVFVVLYFLTRKF